MDICTQGIVHTELTCCIIRTSLNELYGPSADDLGAVAYYSIRLVAVNAATAITGLGNGSQA